MATNSGRSESGMVVFGTGWEAVPDPRFLAGALPFAGVDASPSLMWSGRAGMTKPSAVLGCPEVEVGLWRCRVSGIKVKGSIGYGVSDRHWINREGHHGIVKTHH